VIADCDLSQGLAAKRWFDSVGHYSREDVLAGRIGRPAVETEQPELKLD
jgi:hypothetical protein